jgi:Replication-relaxation
LVVWWSERKCRDRWEPIVRPDGYGRWQEGGRQVDFFLEYDRGTESLDRPAAKLAGYQRLAAVTQVPTPVLFWLPSSGREASVRQALTDGSLWAAMPFPVATASPMLGHSPADAAWLPIGETRPRRCLNDLADLDTRTPQRAGPAG